MVDADKKNKLSSPQQQQAKKRRRAPNSSTSRKKKEVTQKSVAFVEPIKTLIIDNGGSTIKYGWSDSAQPEKIPNITARLKHQFTILVGDELEKIQNPNSLHALTRSTERGMIVNLGNQTQVWKRMLDKLGVSIKPNSEAANAMGWKVNSRNKNHIETQKIPSHSIAVLILLPPFCPRILLDQILCVWMEDFGVSRVGFGVSSILAAKEHSELRCSCTVDFGWSSTLVVPTFKKKPVEPSAIRRMPIGGRHMVNMLKYYMSYRQYNLMDQEKILGEVFEKLTYLSLNFKEEMKIAQYTPSGRRPYDRDYILPDYQTTHEGKTRIPFALQMELEKRNGSGENQEDDDDEDEDFEEGSHGSDGEGENNNSQSFDDDDDDEEETENEKRKRLLKERAERDKLRKEQEEEEQVLRVSVERFAVPEVLFRPHDAGLHTDLVGIAQAVVQAVDACPKAYHAALYQSLFITGGVSKMQNLKIRLEKELRTVVSPDYKIRVELADSPIDQAWIGAKAWAQQISSKEFAIGRDEWETSSKRKNYSRLLVSNGGIYV
jgi:actin-related protein 6